MAQSAEIVESAEAAVPLSAEANIAAGLPRVAAERPFQRAVVVGGIPDRRGIAAYSHWTFQQLQVESDRYAHALVQAGIERGERTLLMVPPGLEFIGLTFALFKLGAVPILIDPGMGKKNLLTCLREVSPTAMLGVAKAHFFRFWMRKSLPRMEKLLSVGGGWSWGARGLESLLPGRPEPFAMAAVRGSDPAAIIFTTGSTGVPKGVVYQHAMFVAQVEKIRDYYKIEPGEIDVAGFPLFALFNTPMGVTTVVPDMDASRPASVDPKKFTRAIIDHGATQSFGSPAIWNVVSRYCLQEGIVLRSLKRVLMAGAPVNPELLGRMEKILAGPGRAHTPYGATESLPVASIDSQTVVAQTSQLTQQGKGTCVGRPFPGVEVRILPIKDDPWTSLPRTTLESGEIGEIAVTSPMTTEEYFHRPESTRMGKIRDGRRIWHRMGDVGYLDAEGRLWFCGRMAHRVVTEQSTLYSVCCEAIFNNHPRVMRSALVGVGPRYRQTPVIIIETEKAKRPRKRKDRRQFVSELLSLGAAHEHTASIKTVLFHQRFPVDIRHNAKIFREQLAEWAARQLKVDKKGR